MKKAIVLSSLAVVNLMSLSSFAGTPANPAWYIKWNIRALFGVSTAREFNLNVAGANNSDNERLSLNTGYGIGFSGGYEFENGFALEGELTHLFSNVKGISGGNLTASVGSFGNIVVTAFMFNGLFYFHNSSKFVPYIGVGIGNAYIKHGWDFTVAGTTTNVSGNGSVFACQGILGVNYLFNRNWSTGVDYRYLVTKKHSVDATTAGGSVLTTQEEYATGALLVSVTYHFV